MKVQRIKSAIDVFINGYGKYKVEMIILAILGFLSGLLEGIGVNAVIPLFSFISNSQEHGQDFVSKFLEKLFNFLGINYNLKYLLVLIFLLFIFKAIVMIVFNYINVRITADYEKKTRYHIFSETLFANWPYLINQKIGYLEQVILTDISRGANLLRHLSGTILLATNLLIYVIIAINISLPITLLTLLIGGTLFLSFKPIFYRARVLSRQQANLNKDVSHLVNENMIGIKTIKANFTEGKVVDKADQLFEKLRETSIKVSFLSGALNSMIEPVGIFFIVIMFAISYSLPGFDFISFAVIIYLVQKIFSFVQTAQMRWQTISELEPFLATTIKYQQAAAKNVEINAGELNFNFSNSLRFENVNFSYTPNSNILSGLSFIVPKGKMIGLIGPSGVGKTTVVDLILRLLNPVSGKILLDDIPVEKISLADWRKKISYVSQDIFLLNDTIANNIRFYDPSISDQEIIEASKLANISEFIEKLPNKLDTIVGERGLLLSGGQRQRIILARALVRKPELLVLDEATSSLDNESEVMIQKAIENLKGKITVIIIAHRLTTIKDCDNLLVMGQGKIIEQGTADSFLKDKESYFYKVTNI